MIFDHFYYKLFQNPLTTPFWPFLPKILSEANLESSKMVNQTRKRCCARASTTFSFDSHSTLCYFYDLSVKHSPKVIYSPAQALFKGDLGFVIQDLFGHRDIRPGMADIARPGIRIDGLRIRACNLSQEG